MQTPSKEKRGSFTLTLIVGILIPSIVLCAGCTTSRQCSPYTASPNTVAKTCSDPNCQVHGRSPANVGNPVARSVARPQPIANPRQVFPLQPTVPVQKTAANRPANVPQQSRHYVSSPGYPPQNDLLSMILDGLMGPPQYGFVQSRPTNSLASNSMPNPIRSVAAGERTQPIVDRSVQVRPLPPRNERSRPTTAAPIQQAAYQVQTSSASPVPEGGVSSELLKPWNVDTLRRTNNNGSPYRLVSEPVNEDKVPPPSGHIARFFGDSTSNSTPALSTQPSQQPTAVAAGPRLPIFDLGKNLSKEFRPSNDRKWTQNHAVLQTADINGNLVTVHNIRYSVYESEEKYTTRYYDATFNLNDIRTIDLIIVPFKAMPRVAHVESSFGFADGRHLGMSIEARYEEGEKYDPVGAGLNQFELIYVFADERDLIRLGTDVHKNDVHVYRLRFEPHEVRTMFIEAVQRANGLAAKPEFYHPIKNSCVTNLIAHVNKARPNAIPKEYRTLLPGLMDNYLYDLKLIDTAAPTFKEAKENAKVNWLVEKYGDLEYFSAGIRQNMY